MKPARRPSIEANIRLLGEREYLNVAWINSARPGPLNFSAQLGPARLTASISRPISAGPAGHPAGA